MDKASARSRMASSEFVTGVRLLKKYLAYLKSIMEKN